MQRREFLVACAAAAAMPAVGSQANATPVTRTVVEVIWFDGTTERVPIEDWNRRLQEMTLKRESVDAY